MADNGWNFDITGVEETALLTLYTKAIESQSADPILKDERAEALVRQIDPLIKDKPSRMAKKLYKRSIDPRLVVHLALRSKKYDSFAKVFLEENPEGIVVNLGCGLDPRFFRIDNGKFTQFDLDLPGIIHLKQQLTPETDRYHLVGQSVLDHSWMDRVEKLNRPVIFLVEGVFMYLLEADVRDLVLAMQRRFPESDLICELTNRTWVEGFWGKMGAMKMKHRFSMAQDAGFRFGVDSPDAMEAWNNGIEFIEQWFYMQDNHPKLGWMRIFRDMPIIRNAQYTVHYKLHSPEK